MENTIGSRISTYRKQKGLKQDQVAEALNVSPQAVSKWENDQSCPDISLLPKLAKLLGVSTDVLLGGEESSPAAVYLPESERKEIKDMMLRMEVHCRDEKDEVTVHIRIPMQLVQIAIETGMELPQVSGNKALQSIDLAQLFNMVKAGAIGNLIEVNTSDDITVRVFVE